MAAKEPTVDQEQRSPEGIAANIVHRCTGPETEIEDPEELIAAAIREALERAWDEGYRSGYSHHSQRNPYRKGDV